MSLLEEEKKAEERQKAIFNESKKLSATYVNGVAVAILAVGGIAPLFAARPLAPFDWRVPAVAVLCLGVSAGLHWAARGFIKDMR